MCGPTSVIYGNFKHSANLPEWMLSEIQRFKKRKQSVNKIVQFKDL